MIAAESVTARAADQDMAVKAEPVVAEGWWFHAYMELAGRGFLNDPNRGGTLSKGTGDSLAKFYEYRDLRPGAFGDGWFATGTNNGLWQIDGWAKNIGWDDQAYQLNVSKAGEHYATFTWDETPHVRSTSAETIYNGIGTNALTLPAGLSNALFNAAGCVAHPNAAPTGCGGTLGAANAAAVQTLINGNLHQTDIGIRRDTASFEYRYTPTDDWDFRVAYSDMHRHGTLVDGVSFTNTASGVVEQVAKPVDDTTQNYSASGEYVGTSPWGQRYNWKVGYSGSTYTDKFNSYTVQNPFCPTGATGAGYCANSANPSEPLALMSLPPSNNANGITSTVGAELPWKSRYMGTFSWTNMRQNDPFLPFTISPTVLGVGGANVASPTVPFASLNGNINTFLSNNVLTTQITPTLKNKASYRYYDYDNGTPEMTFAQWVVNDVQLASVTSTSFTPVTALSMSYTKQNGEDEVTWRPDNHWNLGAAYQFERYDWFREAANATNENSVKLFADYKPTSDVTARASWLFGERRYDNYDYINNMGAIQWSSTAAASLATRTVSAFREFYLEDRNRNKIITELQWDATPQISITPTAGLLFDDYRIDPTSQLGLMHNNMWNAGIEATYALDPRTTFLASYMYEHYNQFLNGTTATGTGNPFATGSEYFATIVDQVHTVMGSVNYAIIPNRLDLKVSYSVSWSRDSQPAIFLSGAGPANGQYPDVTNVWQRFDTVAKYKFDPDWVHSMGWKGDVYAKLMYAWERNSMGNWQNDLMNNYMFNVSSSTGYMTWLAFDNPNYNVHMLMGSIGLGW